MNYLYASAYFMKRFVVELRKRRRKDRSDVDVSFIVNNYKFKNVMDLQFNDDDLPVSYNIGSFRDKKGFLTQPKAGSIQVGVDDDSVATVVPDNPDRPLVGSVFPGDPGVTRGFIKWQDEKGVDHEKFWAISTHAGDAVDVADITFGAPGSGQTTTTSTTSAPVDQTTTAPETTTTTAAPVADTTTAPVGDTTTVPTADTTTSPLVG
jgi:hypothetical protein